MRQATVAAFEQDTISPGEPHLRHQVLLIPVLPELPVYVAATDYSEAEAPQEDYE